MEQEERCRPIPAPRRINPEDRRTNYENVTINIINKNLNINSENIHSITPQNNTCIISDTIDENLSKSFSNDIYDLYGPNANENVPNEEFEAPNPVPRPRKPQNTENVSHSNAIYANSETNSKESSLKDTNKTSPKTAKVQRYTGAISKDVAVKILRKAPELPPKTYLNVNADKEAYRRYSINSSEFSTTSSSGAIDIQDRSFLNTEQYKSGSNGTLNSSVGDSNESAESSKFKSPSPGYVKSASSSSSNNSIDDDLNSNFQNDSIHPETELDANDLLRSLGSTSKLLTESLGERVALKAKGAKHKFDKSLKSSSEAMLTYGTETTNRLKNVSKQLGYNLTSGRKDKDKYNNRNKDNNLLEVNKLDRPQTVPPNDTVFNTISFSSPLSKKITGIDDLRTQELDTSYETPRNCRMTNNYETIKDPPSYDDVINSSTNSVFIRNIPASKSLMTPKRNTTELPNLQLSTSNLHIQDMPKNSNDLASLPMPNFPPPTLPKEIAKSEGIYGKINRISTTKKYYEEIELRQPVDKKLEMIPSFVDRSDSWDYYAKTESERSSLDPVIMNDSWDKSVESDRSSPDPVYINHEATYGKLFEMATSSDILPAEQILINIGEDKSDEHAIERAKPQNELIKEFDPLGNNINSKGSASNQLFLLENLLEEDTYGVAQRNKERVSDEDIISVSTSEEDNSSSRYSVKNDGKKTHKNVKTQATKNDKNTANNDMNYVQIVHQNPQLSDSTDNILEDKEEQIKACLSRVDETQSAKSVDLSRPAQNRTNWFLPEEITYSTVMERKNPFNRSNSDDTESPPTYLEAIGEENKSTTGAEPKSIAQRLMNPKNVFNNVKNRVGAMKRKASFKAVQKTSEVKISLQMVPRPTISTLFVRHEGPLVRFPSGMVEDILKEMQNRRGTLRDRQFQTYQDQEMKTLKECIPFESIVTIQCVTNNRVTDSSTQFYCFEITTSVPKRTGSGNNLQAMSNGSNTVLTSTSSGNCKHQRESHLYGVSMESGRGIWMQKLLESLTNILPAKYTCQYYRAGWCYLKTSITSEWSGAWVVLKKNLRKLIFVTEASMNVEKLDLRKARCIVLKESDETIMNLYVENGLILMIDCPPYTLYMIMNAQRETKVWRHIIREVAHNNGFPLTDQQLTKFNVPVIVDKCINFVYIHGSMSEGIYRKSGSEQSITKLMAAFRADAFNVEITRNEYNEHDVANVLKRFMRDLPERLMGKLSEGFLCISEISVATEKIELYKELLARLSTIERETLKKILGHLLFISSLKDKNKMSIQNLTMIWGPTLLQCQNNSDDMAYSQKESNVLTDLILLYKNLFPLTLDEVKKEQEMLSCLQKYYSAAETLTDSIKKSGDIKMWITLNPNPENTSVENTQINVTITPTKTAYEVCKELAPKMKMSVHEISLFEIILNGDLERPLHCDTNILDVIVKWSYWTENDRKNNILVVKPVDVLREVQRAIKNLATVTPGKELKFADNRTKTFKSYQCELRDGKIVISKKEKNDKTNIVREIFLHSSIAYLGCEKKRDFPWSWAISFIDNPSSKSKILRTRDSPFIGHVLAGSEWMDRTIWLSSIWYFLYGDNILPPAELIIN